MADADPGMRAALLASLERVIAAPPPRVFLAQPGPRPTEPHAYHAAPRLTVITSGCKHITACDGAAEVDWRVPVGSAIFMPPFAWTIPRYDSPRAFIGIVFTREYTRFLTSHHDGRRATPPPPTLWHHVPGALGGPAAHLIQALCARARARRGSDSEDTDGLLLAALVRLARDELAREHVERGGRARATWQALCEHVRDNHHRAITRTSVAAAFRLHPNYVSTLFAEQGGESFAAFMARTRLERAADLLRDGRMGVAEVGAACGYPDPGYFIKAFRRLHRTTPGRFAFLARATPGPDGGR